MPALNPTVWWWNAAVTTDYTRSWPFQMSSQGFCNFYKSDLVHKLGIKQEANFFPLHTVFACANYECKTQRAFREGLSETIWHPCVIYVSCLIIGPCRHGSVVNSGVCAPGPECRHPRLSNTDRTLSNLTQMHETSSSIGAPHAHPKKEQQTEQRRELFQAFPQPMGIILPKFVNQLWKSLSWTGVYVTQVKLLFNCAGKTWKSVTADASRWGLGVNGAGQVFEGHSNVPINVFTDGF